MKFLSVSEQASPPKLLDRREGRSATPHSRRTILNMIAVAALALPLTSVLVGTAFAAGSVSGGTASSPIGASANHPLNVVASFSILSDIVHQIGGDDVKVVALVGPDGDTHTYEPTPADAKRLASAKLLFVNGLNFETWLPGLTKASGFSGKIVVASKGVTPRTFRATDPHDEPISAHTLDPHAWQNLANGKRYAQNVEAGLIAADPAHADAYRERGGAYIAQIDALEARTIKTFAAIPANRRQVVTSHDAFGYFGQAYHVNFIAVAGVSTEAEPSASEMARIIEQVKRENVPAVFLENITSPRLVEQIAREAHTKVGGTLYSDALSKPGTPGATYLGMFEWNIKELSAALKP
jgi:zinc/manganese transport system substrate-binding protein